MCTKSLDVIYIKNIVFHIFLNQFQILPFIVLSCVENIFLISISKNISQSTMMTVILISNAICKFLMYNLVLCAIEKHLKFGLNSKSIQNKLHMFSTLIAYKNISYKYELLSLITKKNQHSKK